MLQLASASSVGQISCNPMAGTHVSYGVAEDNSVILYRLDGVRLKIRTTAIKEGEKGTMYL